MSEIAPRRSFAVDREGLKRLLEFPLIAMAIATAVFIASAGITAGLLELMLREIPPQQALMISDVIVVCAMLAAYKVVIRRLGRHPRDDLGGPDAIREIGLGIGTGFVLFSLIVAAAAWLGVYRWTGAGTVHFLLLALITDGLFPAVGEELLYRGILFRWIEEFGGSWMALIISSLLFGASHLDNPNSGWVAAIGIALEGGLLLGGAYMLTRRLWVPMGIHAAWNVTQGVIYGIPVSGKPVQGMIEAQLNGPPWLTGGGFGLEASPIAILIGTALAIVLIVAAIRAGRLVSPSWGRRTGVTA